MKTCFKCGSSKPIGEFYRHSEMADGHLNKCKECAKRDSSDREKRLRRNVAWVEKELNRTRIKSARARERGKGSSPEYMREKCRLWAAKYPHKVKAQAAVCTAIRNGKLKRLPCQVCGTTENVHAHHPDYSKPLEVEWLCVIHHSREHMHLDRFEKLKKIRMKWGAKSWVPKTRWGTVIVRKPKS